MGLPFAFALVVAAMRAVCFAQLLRRPESFDDSVLVASVPRGRPSGGGG
jgi:hypothetical protein